LISTSPWTSSEDKFVLDQVKRSGKNWAAISRQLKGRTENSTKNRYYAIKKQQKAAKPKPSGTFFSNPSQEALGTH
jgi:hypothetical protein